MKKIFLTLFFIILSTNLYTSNIKKVYFAGGAFGVWEESFDKVNELSKLFLVIQMGM